MEEVSTGALVPAVKPEPVSSSAGTVAHPAPPPQPEVAGDAPAAGVSTAEQLDRDFLCPICMQVIKDAFLTSCGHSFCYMCIITHLRNKSDCPCCGHFLTNNQIFPNFMLDKVRNLLICFSILF